LGRSYVMGATDQLIFSMQERIAVCRRLAKSILDTEAAGQLRRMADEIEADLKRLKAEGDSQRV